MKVWQAHSSEHSASVKIIGTFSTPDAARGAAELFNRLLDIKDKFRLEESSDYLSEIMDGCRQSNLVDFSATDAPQLKFFETIIPAGREIRVEVNATEIQALLKVMIHYGARIEIVSRQPALHP
jgi:hypothetical protein